MKAHVPSEAYEQRRLAKWLDASGLLWCHVPNGGWRDPVTAADMRRQGVKPGVPDVLVFDRPTAYPNPEYGVAIELKRTKGGRLSAEQKTWLAALEKRRWRVFTCQGAEDAIKLLTWLYQIT